MRKFTRLAAAVAATVMLLAGCSSLVDPAAALDKIVADTNAELESEDLGGYTSVETTAEHPSTIVVTYTFAEALDPDASDADFEEGKQAMVDGAQETLTEMKRVGIENPRMRFVFLNPDSTVVWETEAAPADE